MLPPFPRSRCQACQHGVLRRQPAPTDADLLGHRGHREGIGHHTEHETVTVLLGGATTRNFQYTAKADLAAIFNSDSEFIFAVDSCLVKVDEHSGAISLIVEIGVQGKKSNLLRFSYHVQVLSDPVDTMISGTIRWRENLGSPSAGAQAGQPMFRVDVGVYVVGSGGLGGPQLRLCASGFSVGKAVRAGGFWAIAYQVHDVPLGPNFSVVPRLLPNELINLPPGATVDSFGFVSPTTVQLTPAMPAAVGVDFEMVLHQGPN